MPSRVIISSVNTEDAEERRAADFADEASSCPSISRFMCRPARHMWTVSDATRTAATSASTPSHSD